MINIDNKSFIVNDMILNYLDSNYEFTRKSFTEFKLCDKQTKQHIFVGKVFVEIQTMFGCDEDELQPIWGRWMDSNIKVFDEHLKSIGH